MATYSNELFLSGAAALVKSCGFQRHPSTQGCDYYRLREHLFIIGQIGTEHDRVEYLLERRRGLAFRFTLSRDSDACALDDDYDSWKSILTSERKVLPGKGVILPMLRSKLEARGLIAAAPVSAGPTELIPFAE